nr:hypothetical protein [Candidatus Gracilibacteria bacterium]
MAGRNPTEVYDFDKQLINEQRKIEIVNKFGKLINDFLKSTNYKTEEGKLYKEGILGEAKELKDEDRVLLKEYLKEEMEKSTGDDKMQLLELWAGVSNIGTNYENIPLQTINGPQIIRESREYPETIKIDFFSNPIPNRTYTNKQEKLIDYENHGISFYFHDTKWSSERFDVLSKVEIERGNNFNGLINNGESKKLFLYFGRNIEEVELSYNNGILNIVGDNWEGNSIINLRNIRRGNTLVKISTGEGANRKGDGFRVVLNFKLSGI